MRILLLNQTFYPDTQATSQIVTDLALRLAELGHAVTVITDQFDYNSRQIRYAPKENYQGVEVCRVRSTCFGKRSFLFRAIDGATFNLAALIQIFRLPRHDIVVSFTSPPLVGLIGTFYCSVMRTKSVQWLMDVNPDAAIAVGYLKPTGFIARCLGKLFEMTIQHSARLIVLDRWMKERIILRGATPSQIAVIPPWPPEEVVRGKASANDQEFRKELGLEGKFVVLFSGNHSIVHPLDTLLAAAVRLREEDSIRFVFVGGGLRVRDVTAAIQKYRLSNVLQLPKQPKERVADLLASADLHALVLGNEVNGLVHVSKLYGILASGIPYIFVGPKHSHVGDVLAECPHGFQSEHGDVNGLVRHIMALKGLPEEERRRHGQANQRYFHEKFSRNSSLKRFVDEVLEAWPQPQVTASREAGRAAKRSAPLAR